MDQKIKNEKTDREQSLKELLSFKCEDEVELDLNLIENIKKSWIENYNKGGKLHESLLIATKRITPWLDFISPSFQKKKHKHLDLKSDYNKYRGKERYTEKEFEVDPEKLKKYVFLSIPESHFDIDAKFSAGALGPYQFMKRTAWKVFLKIRKGVIDERMDPIKSAEGCAADLAYLNHVCKGDWGLTLSGYNKGLIWDYLRTKPKNPNYEGFLKFLSNSINKKKKKFQTEEALREAKITTHKVEPGQTLFSISKIYNRGNWKRIKELNRLKGTTIKPGQILKLPPTKNQERYKKEVNTDAIIENLKYPAKFEAIMEVLHRLKEKDNFSFNELKNQSPPIRKSSLKKEETLSNFFEKHKKKYFTV